jgi:hypothetical protein
MRKLRTRDLRTAWLLVAITLLTFQRAAAQVSLRADGPGNTYELINNVLGGTAEEVPDCSDPAFGRHITEAWDDTLGKYVFFFHIHVTPDNDRCINFDRQRNEIKTYGPSPTYVKGLYGDFCSYRWKFKLDALFQPSPNFTHIHQIKAGDGSDSDSPILTITPRTSSPDHIELIYTAPTGLSGSGTKATAPLSGFKGQWVEAFEQVRYTSNGTYQLTLQRVSDAAVLLAYTNSNLNLWRGDATFNRPKWGIYRSLISSNYLRDEQVRFADFCIAKGADVCPSDIVPPLTFTLSATPPSETVAAAGSTSYTVTLTTNTGFSGPVWLSAAGLPANTTSMFVPPSLNAPGSSALTVLPTTNTPPGTYTLTVRGTNSPGASNSVSMTLVVTPPKAVPRPVITSVALLAGGLVASGSNGMANSNYYVLACPNLASPMSQWARVATNSFDASGAFTFSNSAALPNQFFLLQVP